MNDKDSNLEWEYLFELKHYCAITFPNTTSALMAEKLLTELGTMPFLIIPSPLSISSGCGLSIKTSTDLREEAVAILRQAAIPIQSVFIIDKATGHIAQM